MKRINLIPPRHCSVMRLARRFDRNCCSFHAPRIDERVRCRSATGVLFIVERHRIRRDGGQFLTTVWAHKKRTWIFSFYGVRILHGCKRRLEPGHRFFIRRTDQKPGGKRTVVVMAVNVPFRGRRFPVPCCLVFVNSGRF